MTNPWFDARRRTQWRTPAVENIPQLVKLLMPNQPTIFSCDISARVALREQLRAPGTIARIDSLKLSDDDLRQLLDITPAVATGDARDLKLRI